MRRELRISVLLLALSTAALPARALVCPPFNEMAVIAKMAAVEAALKAMWVTLFKALSGNLLSYDKRELSAMKVATSQVATAAKAEINAAQTLMKGKMAALGALEQTVQQMQVYRKYSAITGQGVDPCGQLAAQAGMVNATRRAEASVTDLVQRIASAPGRYSSAEGYLERLLRTRQTNFATKDDERLGFGKAASGEVITATGAKFAIAGADTNAGVLFADSSDPRIKLAKEAFLNNIGGVPDAPLTLEAASLPAGKQYLIQKAQKDAAMSAALNSLALIASENSPVNGQDSKSLAMRKLVGQYFGEDASTRWKGWAVQDSRGILADQLKIDAAALALRAEQYKAGQRQEMLLASALVSDVKKQYSPALEQMVQGLERERSRPGAR